MLALPCSGKSEISTPLRPRLCGQAKPSQLFCNPSLVDDRAKVRKRWGTVSRLSVFTELPAEPMFYTDGAGVSRFCLRTRGASVVNFLHVVVLHMYRYYALAWRVFSKHTSAEFVVNADLLWVARGFISMGSCLRELICLCCVHFPHACTASCRRYDWNGDELSYLTTEGIRFDARSCRVVKLVII
jgi:hypothetical protein